ncbi:hypothetical protein ILUMI_17060 [Ignelater luminosus]|uniref:HAT C-terminal dimerisation domain-containing protein n=1 Tax=Ignelater luminosus TaxID=2038154 RepID=A0A8K0CR55_IGNLU|nr:hypothetical protein ILUMI_17060 [Ignelater luminosus]
MFLEFIPIREHKSEYLAETILNLLENHDIPIKDCRGQSYDNASNMLGKYTGLQVKIKEKCEFATFVPCASHSLNLVGVHAAGWSAQADGVSAFHEGHKQIIESLMSIAEDTEQPRETRHEDLSLSRKMENLEFIILTEIWSIILERIDKTSNYLQKETITMDVATNLFTSLDDFIINLRNKFDYFESSAKEKNPESDYKDISQRTREDISEKELEMECLHLTEYLKIVQSSENEETNSLSGIYHLLKKNKIEDTFPNVEIALRIFLSMMVTNCSGEHSLSKLKIIKNELRSTMLQERLNSLSLMFIECDVLKDKL